MKFSGKHALGILAALLLVAGVVSWPYLTIIVAVASR